MKASSRYRARVISGPSNAHLPHVSWISEGAGGRRTALFREMGAIGVHPEGAKIMCDKAESYVVKLHGLSPPEALILKQEALSCDGDLAIAAGIVSRKSESTDALLVVSRKQAEVMAEKLKRQPFKLSEAGQCALEAIENFRKNGYELRGAHGIRLSIGPQPLIMGILNVTPDSFSDGGLFEKPEAAVEQARSMVGNGADIIDVGGESTRPGAEEVHIDEELKRTIPVIQALRDAGIDIPISIDTTKAPVAEAAVDAGANIINDVSGMMIDEQMLEAAARTEAGVCLMHMKGRPRDMQKNPEYSDLMEEVTSYLRDASDWAVSAGVKPESIILDPGIGFGKTLSHNIELMQKTGELKSLGYPVLAGPSRKSWLGGLLGKEVDERLIGTVAAVAALVMAGISIVRVHDVAEARQAVTVASSIRHGCPMQVSQWK